MKEGNKTMLGQELELVRLEVTVDGKTENVFFESYEKLYEWQEVMYKHYDAQGIKNYEFCLHGTYFMKVTGC